MKKPVTNIAASVQAKLKKKADAAGGTFNELVQYYAIERFLYRLSRSKHADRFVLKGALMLKMWASAVTRVTKDIDLLGRRTASVDDLVSIVRDCLAVEVADDGIRFDAASVRGEEIRIDAEYGGIRLTFKGRLGNTRLSVQVDVGFGDTVTPQPVDLLYPAILDFESPRLRAYTPETAIAEKVHAMVTLGTANSRMKDYLDIWGLARSNQFAGEPLALAIAATFKVRKTSLPESTPIGLTSTFCDSPVTATQWNGYLRKGRVTGAPSTLAEALPLIRGFVAPVLEALAAKQSFVGVWKPGGPWST